jgi:hypothetical protein
MATSRLTFLYPHFFRAGGRWSEHAASNAGRSSRRKPSSLTPSPVCCQPAAPFTTPSAGRQAAFAKRAGKGVEPLSFQESPKTQPNSEEGKQGGKDEAKGTAPPTQTPPASTPRDGSQQSSPPPAPDLPPTIELPPPGDINPVTQVKKGTPMDEILHMGPPPDSLSPPPPLSTPPATDEHAQASSKSTDATTTTTSPSTSTSTASATTADTRSSAPADKTPHLKPPQYVHHFDSYTLVRQLTAGGYTLPQAILAMKAIRTILASNLDAAQSGLVSKADVENETYLFRAACSELSAEVHNNRRVADEQMRQQRTLLQHEVDILAQRLNQELLTLNDTVRGMFNDRRMTVREEQKAVESRVCFFFLNQPSFWLLVWCSWVRSE